MGDRVAVLQRRRAAAVRHAAGALRPPGQRVCRRVHRLAGDEPDRRARSTADGVTIGTTVIPLPRDLQQAAGDRPRSPSGCAPRRSSSPARARGIPVVVNLVEELGAEAYVYAQLKAHVTLDHRRQRRHRPHRTAQRAPQRREHPPAREARLDPALRHRDWHPDHHADHTNAAGRERRVTLIGLDVGTTGVKAIAITAEESCSQARSEEYPLSTPRPGWAEQDPEDWWRAAEPASRRCRPGEIGLSGPDARAGRARTARPGAAPGDPLERPAHRGAVRGDRGRGSVSSG